MNLDEEGEVINGEDTYEQIAAELTDSRAVLVGWTDGAGSHFDILFNLSPFVQNPSLIQGGLKGFYLYISIMRVGAFGFDVSHYDTSPQYYEEKFGVSLGGTADGLATLINEVKKRL